MKFIRVKGRIVPVREKGESDKNPYRTAAALGAGAGASNALSIGALRAGKVKTAIAFGAASIGAGLTGLYKNAKNSVQHANQKDSLAHGLGRFIGLSWTKSAGAYLGMGGAAAVAKGVTAIKKSSFMAAQNSSLAKGAITLKKMKGGGYGY